MFGRNIFVGSGDFGNRVAEELSIIKRNLREEIHCEDHENHPDYLSIHSLPSIATSYMATLKDNDHFIIMAGSTLDHSWEETRKSLHEAGPYFMLSIGIDVQREINVEAFQPFGNECLVFPDPSLFDPLEIAKLIMQIIFIHESWQSNLCIRGSLISYDLGDTKELFASKITKASKVKSDKDHYRELYSEFIIQNKEDLRRTEGIHWSIWGWNEIISFTMVHELFEKAARLLTPDAYRYLTCHIVPDEEQAFEVLLFITL